MGTPYLEILHPWIQPTNDQSLLKNISEKKYNLYTENIQTFLSSLFLKQDNVTVICIHLYWIANYKLHKGYLKYMEGLKRLYANMTPFYIGNLHFCLGRF